MQHAVFTVHTGCVLVEVGNKILYTGIIYMDGNLQNINFHCSFQTIISVPSVINGKHDELCILRCIHRALIPTVSSYAIG
jgi:hypothetical protein